MLCYQFSAIFAMFAEKLAFFLKKNKTNVMIQILQKKLLQYFEKGQFNGKCIFEFITSVPGGTRGCMFLIKQMRCVE
jgi:hypothetical protein